MINGVTTGIVYYPFLEVLMGMPCEPKRSQYGGLLIRPKDMQEKIDHWWWTSEGICDCFRLMDPDVTRHLATMVEYLRQGIGEFQQLNSKQFN